MTTTFSKLYLFLAIPVVIFASFFLPNIQYVLKLEKERETIEKYKEWRKQSLENWQNANHVPIEHADAFKKAVEESIQQHQSARSLTTTQ